MICASFLPDEVGGGRLFKFTEKPLGIPLSLSQRASFVGPHFYVYAGLTCLQRAGLPSHSHGQGDAVLRGVVNFLPENDLFFNKCQFSIFSEYFEPSFY